MRDTATALHAIAPVRTVAKIGEVWTHVECSGERCGLLPVAFEVVCDMSAAVGRGRPQDWLQRAGSGERGSSSMEADGGAADHQRRKWCQSAPGADTNKRKHQEMAARNGGGNGGRPTVSVGTHNCMVLSHATAKLEIESRNAWSRVCFLTDVFIRFFRREPSRKQSDAITGTVRCIHPRPREHVNPIA